MKDVKNSKKYKSVEVYVSQASTIKKYVGDIDCRTLAAAHCKLLLSE